MIIGLYVDETVYDGVISQIILATLPLVYIFEYLFTFFFLVRFSNKNDNQSHALTVLLYTVSIKSKKNKNIIKFNIENTF